MVQLHGLGLKAVHQAQAPHLCSMPSTSAGTYRMVCGLQGRGEEAPFGVNLVIQAGDENFGVKQLPGSPVSPNHRLSHVVVFLSPEPENQGQRLPHSCEDTSSPRPPQQFRKSQYSGWSSFRSSNPSPDQRLSSFKNVWLSLSKGHKARQMYSPSGPFRRPIISGFISRGCKNTA